MKTTLQLQKIFNKNNIRRIIYLILLGLSLSLFTNLFVMYFSLDKIFPINTSVTDTIKTMPFYQTIILFGFIFPIIEELIFRFLIFGFLRKRTNYVISAIISSAIFGLLHGSLIQFVFAFLAGMIFCIIYEKYKHIIYTMISHICVNLSTLFIYPEVVNKGRKVILFYIVISLVVLICCIYELIFRRNINNEIN